MFKQLKNINKKDMFIKEWEVLKRILSNILYQIQMLSEIVMPVGIVQLIKFVCQFKYIFCIEFLCEFIKLGTKSWNTKK